MGQLGLEFRGGTQKNWAIWKTSQFLSTAYPQKKGEKNSPASDKNVDTKRLDTIVVVHGLTELLCSLAAAAVDAPPPEPRDAAP